MKKVENYQLCCVQPIFFQKFHFAFIFHFPSGTDFQLIYRGGANNWGKVSYSPYRVDRGVVQCTMYRAVKFAKMIIETSMASQSLSGGLKVPFIHPDQIPRELAPPNTFKYLGRVPGSVCRTRSSSL